MANLEWIAGMPVGCVKDPAENLGIVMMALTMGCDVPKVGGRYTIAAARGCGLSCLMISLREIQAARGVPMFCKEYFRLLEPKGMEELREALAPKDGGDAPVKKERADA